MRKTAVYSALHLLVDGVCAFAMLGRFALGSKGAILFLIYNFCAFALQMPIGALLDLLLLQSASDKNDAGSCGFGADAVAAANRGNSAKLLWGCAAAGAVLTLAGAFVHPVVLGTGNALFHAGGGVEIIRTDRAEGKKGSLLGIFVAPGAFGLFLGAQIAGTGNGEMFLGISAVFMAWMLWMAFSMIRSGIVQSEDRTVREDIFDNFRGFDAVLAAAGCFAVVVLRSYIGLAVTFPWKTTFVYGLVSVLAVVFGKMAGGILAAGFGKVKVVIFSLLIAAVGYCFLENPFAGIAALFFFNMTMPITLHILTEKFPAYSGFAFGLLTFALFLGFLPIGLGNEVPVSGNRIGLAGSIISAIVLLAVLHSSAEGRR